MDEFPPKRPRPPSTGKVGRPKGGVGTPNRVIDYRCTTCDKVKPRDELLAKRVSFSRMGRGGKLIQSRIRGWVCMSCLPHDPDWCAPKFSAAPGMKGTSIAQSES